MHSKQQKFNTQFYMKFLYHLALIMFVVCGAQAQNNEDTRDVKPRVLLPKTAQLTDSEKKQIEQRATQAAFSLFTALKNNDWNNINKFIPTKEVYAKMIENFGAPDGETSSKIVALDKIYPQEKKRIENSFTQVQKMLKKYPNFTADQFVLLLKENVSLRGGKGALVIKDKSGKEQHVINFFKYYEWNGQWYVTNKLFWFK